MSFKTIKGASATVEIETPTGNLLIGIAETVNVSEDTPAQAIKGLGTIYPQEIAVTDWNGSGTISVFHVNYKESRELALMENRNVGLSSLKEYQNYVISRLKEQGAILRFYEERPTGEIADDGTPITEKVSFATVKYCFFTSMNWSLGVGQVSRRNLSFLFTDAQLYE